MFIKQLRVVGGEYEEDENKNKVLESRVLKTIKTDDMIYVQPPPAAQVVHFRAESGNNTFLGGPSW